MNPRHLACIALVTVAACGGPKVFGSLCTDDPAPVACGMTCDPLPGATNSCGTGFHCSEAGLCDAQCTVGGTQCGDGYTCTADGYCIDDSGPGSNGPDASCPAVNFTPTPKTPSILLVLDQSGSMFENNLGGTSRYVAMKDALIGAQGVVTGLETKAYFGSELYTCNGNANDFTNVPRALTNAAAIRTSLDSKTGGQNTPTPAAINAGAASFVTTPPPPDSPPVIVLATDGLPNVCGNGDADTRPQSVSAAAASYAAGVPVYVLAINSADQHFQNLANAGQGHVAGQPNIPYYPVTSVQQLKDAFNTIIAGVISCDLTLTSSIDDASAMGGTVTVNGTVLTYGSDWVLVGGNSVRLLGSACTTLKNAINPTVSASFPCGSVIF